MSRIERDAFTVPPPELPPVGGAIAVEASEAQLQLMMVGMAKERAALESRSSTVAPRVGSPGARERAQEAHLQELDAFATQTRRAIVPKPKSLTPLPSLRAEDARRQASLVSSGPTPDPCRSRCLYGRKAKRRMAHPLEEQRLFFDVWPASNRSALAALSTSLAKPTTKKNQLALSTTHTSVGSNDTSLGGTMSDGAAAADSVFSRPQLLLSMEAAIRTELQRLNGRFPSLAATLGPVNAPPEEQLTALLHDQRPTGGDEAGGPHRSPARCAGYRRVGPDPDAGELIVADEDARAATGPRLPSSCSDEDTFRVERIRVFSAAAKDFATQFKSYRRLLLWIVREFDQFVAYCHENVWSPDARAAFERRVQEDAEQAANARVAELRAELATANAAAAAAEEKHAALLRSTAGTQQVIADQDLLIRAKDRELAEAGEGRAALLRQIHLLEKEVWKQRNLMEGPEKRIAELNKTIKDLQDRLERANLVYEENGREKAVLRARIERLEETLRERKKQGSQQVSRVELLAVKRREMEVLEQNAALQAKLVRVQQRLHDTQDALAALKSDRVTTPRPQWGQVDDIFPRAPSTAQRVAIAAQEYRSMLDQKDGMAVELTELKELIGALPRGDENARSPGEVVVPQMQSVWFTKLGLDAAVPAYLKGVGRVINLKLSREAMQGYCRLWWIEREGSRLSTSLEQFVSRFCTKNAPEGVPADAFAYSFYHALHWYAFDAVIGFTRDLVIGAVDDLVFRDMVARVAELKTLLLAAEGARPDATDTGNATLSKLDTITILVEHLVTKEEEEVKRLIINVSRDCPGKDVELATLFGFSSEEQRFSNFLEEFYAQFLDDRAKLVKQYEQAVHECELDQDGNIAPPELCQQLWHIDPEIPAQLMDEMMANFFDVDVEALFPSVDVYSGIKHVGANGERVYGCGDVVTNDVPSILKKLRSRVLRRFTLASNVVKVRERQERAALARQQAQQPEPS